MMELAAERGFKSTSVDDVVRCAGVSHAAFARHFDSLESCFATVWNEVDDELSRRMTAAFYRRDDWQDRLRDSLLAASQYLAGNECRARFYVAEVLYVNDEMRVRHRAAMARLSLTIDLGRETPDADQAPPAIADAISGAIWHRVHKLVQAGRGSELPGEVARLMYLAVLPYRGAAAAQAELHRA